ncbi:MAG: hypothetical protein OER87_06960 [Gammaproteobacteria bacterium]|nr:hypothetical protein [Gammaproteobacteria bacterium]
MALLAVGAYFTVTQFSSPVERDLMSEFRASPTATPGTAATGDSTSSVAPVDVLLVGLRQRLEAQPDDVDGWILLSKSYYHLDQFKEANEAFERARAQGYAGSWQPLPRIDAFGQSGTGIISSINFQGSQVNGGSANAAATPTGAGASAGLKLKVSLDPALTNAVAPDSAVFVFVRAAQNPGPPLAVVRKRVDELPFEIALNDSNAMVPGKTISSAASVIVGARISASGNPQRQPGDYEQLSSPIPSDFGEPIELLISNKI